MEPVFPIESYKEGSSWFSRGDHFYVTTRAREASTSLRCHSDGCPVRFLIRNGHPGPVTGEHDHEPTPWIPNRNAMFQALKRRATMENIPLNAIYEEEAARFPDAAAHLLFESVGSSMRKWRRTAQPPVPQSLEGLGAALTEHPRLSGMLLATVSAGGAHAIILHMSGSSSCLQACHSLVVDGTFLTTPAGLPASQVLTLHCVVEGHNFHPVIAIMQNRRRPLYEAVLQRIWQAAGHPRPAHIITDFEPALQAALASVSGVRVQGCLFHYVQALLRRARAMGLHVQRNSPGWRLVRLYSALALLPAARVALAVPEIPHIATAEGLPFNDDFHRYFVSHWMDRVTPDAFSVHGSAHQTSNVAESFHASLRRSLGPAPNVWRFTEVVAEKFAVSASRLAALRAGQHPPRRARERSYVRANILRSNERALERGLITLREYLLATSRLLRVGVVDNIGIVIDDVPDVAEEVVLGADGGALEEPPIPAVPLPVVEPEVVLDLAPEQLPVPEPEVVQRPGPVIVICNICTERPPTMILRPCGHLLCSYCRERVNDCPFCRSFIIEAMRFYL